MLPYELFVAFRYLFSKKSHNVINIISMISVVGVAVTTMALVCTLSVYNGFQGLVADLFTGFDPELKVTAAKGAFMDINDKHLRALQQSKDVAVLTPVMEGQALVIAGQEQVAVTLKGVDDNYTSQSNIADALYGEANGVPSLHIGDILEYGIPGIQLCSRLGIGVNSADPLQIYAPKQGERVNMANPTSSFNHDELQMSGVVFSVHQNKYDANYILCSLGFAQRIFDQRGRISALEIKLANGGRRSNIEALLGKDFRVQDRYEQQEDVFRIMKIEKRLTYAFLCFILIVACLNIVGSLSMLMIEKKKDIRTLSHLGATVGQIQRIFIYEGQLITIVGAVAGLVLGFLLCLGQQHFGWIRMGQSEGSFIIDAYPVIVNPLDILVILATVISVGSISVYLSVKKF